MPLLEGVCEAIRASHHSKIRSEPLVFLFHASEKPLGRNKHPCSCMLNAAKSPIPLWCWVQTIRERLVKLEEMRVVEEWVTRIHGKLEQFCVILASWKDLSTLEQRESFMQT